MVLAKARQFQCSLNISSSKLEFSKREFARTVPGGVDFL